MANSNLTYTKLADRNSSFQLIRTNPKLTTNLKLTVDSAGSLWLNSIDANEQLADQKYKRFAISETSSHEVNLYRFYDNGKTPASIAYELGSTIGKTATAKNLSGQYDFDLYSSGAKYLLSKQYSEKFSYLAPLYLDNIRPEKFVIFKIPGASNYTAGIGKETIPNITIADFATELFKNATIVKVIDLTPASKIGQYIENIIKNPMFTQNPLYVNYKDSGYSLYRGASINSGTYVEIPEQLSSVFTQSLPLLTLEKFVTLGFERNKIVHPRILNLEFLFDDTTSNPYEFNRYIGFYCNEIDLTTLELDLKAMYLESVNTGLDNSEIIPTLWSHSDDISFNLSNETGVKLRGCKLTEDLSDLTNNRTSSDTLFFPYLKTKDGLVHLINPEDWTQHDSLVEFKIDDRVFDFGTAFGPSELIVQETIEVSKSDTRSSLAVEVLAKPQHLDVLRVYHPTGSVFNKLDLIGKYDDFVFVSGYFTNNESYSISYPTIPQVVFSVESDPNDVGTTFSPNTPEIIGTQYVSSIDGTKWRWDGISYVPDVIGSRIYVNTDKDIEQIAQAISDILVELKDSSIFGITMNSTVFIQARKLGDSYGELKIKTLEAQSSSPKFKINNQITTDVVYADGGFVEKPHPIINIGNITKLTSQLSDIVIKTTNNWSEISRICPTTDKIKIDLSEADQKVALDYFANNATIMLTDNEVIDMTYNKIEVRKLFKPSIGVLSFFEIKDFDFSTYSSNYSRTLDLDLYKDYYVPANVSILDFTKYSYQIIGTGTISVNNTIYTNSQAVNGSRPLVWQNTDKLSKYTVLNGEAILVKSNKYPGTTFDVNDSTDLYTRLDLSYYDETGDAANYIGPFALKAEHVAPNQNAPTYSYRDKYLYGNISSEYHAYLENFVKDFAVDGRVVPYISKWGAIDSTDSRDNQYRLNADILFSKDNFGPSHRETSATPEKLTHEWFYIESDFDYSLDESLARKNFYYFNTPFSEASLISDSEYFNTYFTYIPVFNGNEVGIPQYRYSLLNKNQFTNQYEALFKGALFRFYELDQNQNPLTNTDRFNDYKFSIILKPVKEDHTKVQQPVKYKIIENTDSKSITVLVEVILGYKAQLINDIFYKGWSTLTDDQIEQSSLFTGSFTGAPVNYTIDKTIEATSLSDYLGKINGSSILNGVELGETVHVYYGTVSAIIATAGSKIYDDVLSGKVSTGDLISERIYTAVTQSTVTQLPSGTYQAVKIEAIYEDCWNYINGSISPSSGQISSDSANTFDQTTTTIYINTTTAPSSPFFSNGGLEQNAKLSTISAGSEVSIVNESYEEALYTIASSSYGSSVYTITIDTASNGLTVPLSDGDPIVFKTKWFIPLSYNSNSIVTDSFSIKQKKLAYFDSIFGDYRIEFNEANVSNLTHSFLYYAKNKKYNNKETAYSTIKLSRGINLSPSGVSLALDSAQTLNLPGLENYDVFSDSEINQTSLGFAPMYVIKPGEKNILIQTSGLATNLEDISDPVITQDGVSGASADLIRLSPVSGYDAFIISPIVSNLGDLVNYSYSSESIPTGTTNRWLNDAIHFQIFGGFNYFDKIFENLSFAKFANLLDKNQGVITWETYTDGSLVEGRKFSIEIVSPDTVFKSSMVQITPESVQSGQINQTAGFTLSEVATSSYEVNRYSSEYDVIFKPISGFKYNFQIGANTLTGANACLNTKVKDFFVIPDFEYVKYSKTTILDLENSLNYSSVYPLINETPIARTNFNALSSSWDYNYHFSYLNKSEYVNVPGSNRVIEDYSFVSKLLNLPTLFTIEDFTSLELTNSQYLKSNSVEANLVYSKFGNQIRFKLNIADLITRHLSDNGLRAEFQKFFKYSNGLQITSDQEFLADLQFEQFLSQYCLENLVKLYQIEGFEFYEADDRTIANNLVQFMNIQYSDLGTLGYNLIRTIKINNTKSSVVEGSIIIKPNTGVKLVPKIKIKFI